MNRSAWIAWVIAVVMICLGLWLADHARSASLICMVVAIVLMAAVAVLDVPTKPLRQLIVPRRPREQGGTRQCAQCFTECVPRPAAREGNC